MRIQCTFNLAPELHEQHRFTVENLRAWHISEKQRNDDKDVAQQRRSIFHRDIYLSGLYLYQISAELPKLVSEQYKAGSIDVTRLTKQLAIFENPIDELKDVNDPVITLADSQWQKMEQLLNSHQQQLLAEQKTFFETAIATQDRASDAQAQNESKADHVLAVTVKLAEQLTSMQQQQTQLLARIEQVYTHAKDPALVANEWQGVEPLLDQNKSELLQAIEVNQQWLVSAFNTLKQQVGQLNDNPSQQVYAFSQINAEKAALTSQLQRASKVKSKGLW